MSDELKFVQTQPYSLAGAGASANDPTIVLSSMKDINGVLLTMADFGTIGFATIEPGNGINEEQISFSGITQNSNGTATLTGVYTVLMKAPYTPTLHVGKTHAGGTVLVISNTAGFYDRLTSKNDDETIAGDWTFSTKSPTVPTELSSETHRAASIEYVNTVGSTGTPDANTSVKGKSKLSTTPVADPIAVGDNDTRVPTQNENDALVGTGTPSSSDKYVNRSTLTSEEAAFELLSNKSTTTTLGGSNTLYPSQNAVKTYVDNHILVAIASDTLQQSADTERTLVNQTGYTLKKSIRANLSGIYRIAFEGKPGTYGYPEYAKIYKNGVAYGAEQYAGDAAYTVHSQDLQFTAGDTIELWIHCYDSFTTVYVKNFRVYFTPTLLAVPAVVTD